MDPPSQTEARPLTGISIQPCGPPHPLSLPPPTQMPSLTQVWTRLEALLPQAITCLDLCYTELTIIFLTS